jgi:acyl-CoA synthetase (AMP-forming)/AMP-acid ligase II
MTDGPNFAAIWGAVARATPDTPALIHGASTTSWAGFDRRANGVASALLTAGVCEQESVAQYLYNCPEYMESMFACFKGGLVPVNTNYRYTETELLYLWGDADARAVIFGVDFAGTVEKIRGEMPDVRSWICVDDGTTNASCPSWAMPYEEAAARPPMASRTSSGDDLYLLYTGGTTGLPKGVMWRQEDFINMLESSRGREIQWEGADERVASLRLPGPRLLSAAPLMHGTAAWACMNVLDDGGCVITLPERRFDPEATLNALVEHRATGVCIVGDAFARPLVDTLRRNPDRWDLASLRVVLSGGVMFSAETKSALLQFAPNAMIVDNLGSSESGSAGNAVSRSGAIASTARFRINATTRVIDEAGQDVEPGSGRSGRLAVGGYIPLGYRNDPEKTSATFVTLDGMRYVVAGDWARVEVDGTITLLGRGSVCINTGGEKVYPEEVEEVLKTFAGVADAAVVGVPDPRFGEQVVAMVEPRPEAEADTEALLRFARTRLAGYKVPKAVHWVESVGRAPNGKLDYRRLAEIAREEVQPV